MDKYVYKNISEHICLIYHTTTHTVAALVLNIPLQYSPWQRLQLVHAWLRFLTDRLPKDHVEVHSYGVFSLRVLITES